MTHDTMTPSHDPTPKKPKQRWTRREAAAVAEALIARLDPFCERIIVAGSLRRGAGLVGDVELLYISRTEPRPFDLFSSVDGHLADEEIERMLGEGVLARREFCKGWCASWGALNKLAVHLATGIPVDLFCTSSERWANSLVCRTGPASSNIRLASAALARGYEWQAYGAGFARKSDRRLFPMTSEKEVFDFVGLPFLPPCER